MKRTPLVALLAAVGLLAVGCGTATHVTAPKSHTVVTKKTHKTHPSNTQPATQPVSTAPPSTGSSGSSTTSSGTPITVAQIDQVVSATFKASLGVTNITFGAPPSATGVAQFQADPSNASIGKVSSGASNLTFLGGWQPAVSGPVATQEQSYSESITSLLHGLPSNATAQMKASPTIYVTYAYASNGTLSFLIFWQS